MGMEAYNARMEAAGQKSEMGAQVSASDASSLEIAPALLSYDDWSETYLKDAHASLTHDSLSLLVNKLSRLKMILRRISDAGGSRLAVARLPTHLYAYMYVCMYVCTHACMYVCMHACMHACMHVWMDGWMHACTYVRMYVG